MGGVRTAAIYARISSDQAGTGLGVQRQIEDCQKLARERGWTVAEVYQDNDVSAYSGKRRPGYERMLADLADGLRDAVIVYNLDRLHRRPAELEAFAELCGRAGVTNVATVTADIDLGNDDGLFMARVFAAFAAKESGRRSARIRRKMEEVAAAGLPHGGSNRPFGYDEDRITIRESEAALVRQMAERFLAGDSSRSLAAWLQEAGVPTVEGKPWRSPGVTAILTNPRIAGLRAHNGVIVGPAVWEPIITEEQHRRIKALIAQRAVSGKRSPRRYLLSGLLRCGRCGGKLFSAARENTRRYVCLRGPDHGGCGRLTVVASPVETLITEGVLHRLDTRELADALAGRAARDDRLAVLSDALADDQAQLQELSTAYGEKRFSMREWLDARRPIESRILAAEKQLAQATQTDALIGLPGNGTQLRASWNSLNLTQQAAIISAVLDHAVIAPGVPGARRVESARVQPVWRL